MIVRLLRHRPSPAIVIACVALLIALGGVSYAATALPRNSVGTAQLKNNSVIQDHYGDVLFKLSRLDEAISAWTRALAGDNDSIDRPAIDKKIKTAKQKLGKK